MNFFQKLFGGGGTPTYKNINGAEFEKLLAQTPDAVVIDVRTISEFKTGHIPKSKNIDWMSGEFSRKIATLDKNKTYFLYCRSGNRSGQAAKALGNNGFEKIFNLSGGIGHWSGKIER
jgi:rhodanese-related sulfurtransferase